MCSTPRSGAIHTAKITINDIATYKLKKVFHGVFSKNSRFFIPNRTSNSPKQRFRLTKTEVLFIVITGSALSLSTIVLPEGKNQLFSSIIVRCNPPSSGQNPATWQRQTKVVLLPKILNSHQWISSIFKRWWSMATSSYLNPYCNNR